MKINRQKQLTGAFEKVYLQNAEKKIARLKDEARKPKHELYNIMDDLFNMGAYKEAKQLQKIITKLDTWQQKK